MSPTLAIPPFGENTPTFFGCRRVSRTTAHAADVTEDSSSENLSCTSKTSPRRGQRTKSSKKLGKSLSQGRIATFRRRRQERFCCAMYSSYDSSSRVTKRFFRVFTATLLQAFLIYTPLIENTVSTLESYTNDSRRTASSTKTALSATSPPPSIIKNAKTNRTGVMAPGRSLSNPRQRYTPHNRYCGKTRTARPNNFRHIMSMGVQPSQPGANKACCRVI